MRSSPTEPTWLMIASVATALSILGVVMLILGSVSLLISRRFGDRVQSRLLLSFGLLGVGLFTASLITYGSSSDDWVGLAISLSAVCVAVLALRGPDWHTTVYLPWSRRHRRYSRLIDLSVIPVSLGIVFGLNRWFFGTHSAVTATVTGAAAWVVLLVYGRYRRARRERRADDHMPSA